MALEKIVGSGTTELMKKLVAVAAQNIGMVRGLDKELQKLKKTLQMIAAVTSDADKKQVKDIVVLLWLRRLQDVAYDVDDVLDEISYEAMRQEIKQDKVLWLSTINFGFKMAKKIKKLNQELDEIAKHKVMFQLDQSSSNDSANFKNIDQQNRLTASFLSDVKIVGRKEDKSHIVKMLLMMANPLSPSSSSEHDSPPEKISVVSIVGMGGLGKTTLAQMVYKDHSIERNFEPRAWVCISDHFDIFQILRNILESVTNRRCDDLSNVDVLVGKVHKEISGKKYLLVLDDLWNENAEDWEKLKGILSVGAHGSKILVTTRKHHVASIVRGIIPPYILTTLSGKDCWSIIKNKAFAPGGALETPNMSNIGEGIARKCDGLPLAAHFLGNLMRLKREECDWLAIRDNKSLNTLGNPNKILQILKLSYDNLSPHLKQCFSYCSLFPKDWVFYRKTLIRLWMAEGFLHPCDGENQNSLEDIGNDYLESLLSNSFFQNVVKDELLGDIIRFKMHDLVHDLAQSVACSYGASVVNVSEMDNGVSEIRRLQLIVEDGIAKGASNILNEKAKKLRTIFCRDVTFRLGPLRNKRLRVMYSLGPDGLEIPSTPFIFKHLRYLEIAYSKVDSIHAPSIGQLYNLQTLDLCKSQNVQKILEEIGSLKNLCHLILSESDVKVLDDSITRLTNLQTLDMRECLEFEALPVNIGSLQRMLFLDISYTNIKELPDSVTSICNLKRLELHACEELEVLPVNFGALTRLQSLDLRVTGIRGFPDSVSGCCSLEDVRLTSVCEFPKDITNWAKLRRLSSYGERFDDAVMPSGIEMLSCLEELDPYVVTRKEGEVSTGTNISSGIEELADLNSIRVLGIANLEYVRGSNIDSVLKYKQKIEKLTLRWKPEEAADSNNSFMVLEGLQPHPNLKYLEIFNFPGLEFPKWFGSSSCLSNLETLKLSGCNRCEKLPPLGMLPCLRHLHLRDMLVKHLGEELYIQESSSSTITLFPSLIFLRIWGMCKLEIWVAPPATSNSFPFLEEIQFDGCPELTSVPDFRLWSSSSLRGLTIYGCGKLKESIPYDLQKSLTFLQSLKLDFIQGGDHPRHECDLINLKNRAFKNQQRASTEIKSLNASLDFSELLTQVRFGGLDNEQFKIHGTCEDGHGTVLEGWSSKVWQLIKAIFDGKDPSKASTRRGGLPVAYCTAVQGCFCAERLMNPKDILLVELLLV